MLERIGLLVRKDSGGHYDRFKGRVLFSIRDPQGRPVAVGGRLLPGATNSSPAKYINSPESPLFSKSQMLYALDAAREAIAASHRVVVMEGYTDCIVAQQCGFNDAVAVLGTALGERHIHLLRRYADTIVLVLDGDEAGQRRTNEILSLFVAEQVDLRIVTLPKDLDPCEFLLEHGAEAFQTHLAAAVDALEHAFRIATRGLDIANQPHEATRALDGLLQTIARAPRLRSGSTSEQRVREWTMLGRLARLFAVDETVIRARVTDLRGKSRLAKPAASETESSAKPLAPLNAWDRELLEILLMEPESVAAVAEVVRPEQLESEPGRRLFAKSLELAAAGTTPTFDRLLLEIDDPQYKNLLVDLDEQGRAKGTHETAVRLRELLDGFRRRDGERQARPRPHVAGAAARCRRRTGPAPSNDRSRTESARHFRAHGWVGCLAPSRGSAGVFGSSDELLRACRCRSIGSAMPLLEQWPGHAREKPWPDLNAKSPQRNRSSECFAQTGQRSARRLPWSPLTWSCRNSSRRAKAKAI